MHHSFLALAIFENLIQILITFIFSFISKFYDETEKILS
jgi:hypothetical protein